MSASSPHYSFVPDPHTAQYLAMDTRTHDRSPSPARKFWPFNRSRSSSPNTQNQLHVDTSFNSTRSRRSSNNSPAISPSGSASSFVVRSVIRNPGGVSMPGSPANESAQPFFPQQQQQPRRQSNSPARRMTLEDSDDEGHTQHQLQYRRSKSKPLGAAPASLGVPPGGPGGGIGYGTAQSSNDGRPEAAGAQPSPYYRPASPSASIKAGDFNRAKERGRSPRKSVSAASASSQDPRSGSANSAASACNAKKPVARITAGPKSLAQQQHEQQHPQLHQSSRGPSPAGAPRQPGLSGPRQFPAGPPVGFPAHQHPHPHAQPPQHHNAGFGFPPMQPPSMPHAEEARDESPTRSRRFSFGIGRTRKDSDKQSAPAAAAAPLDGLPSPVDIPYGRSPHSPLRFDAGADTDYSRANSPFGSVSPARLAGSPNSSGFINTLMGRHSSGDHTQSHDNVLRSCSPGGGSHLAGKWFKGVFGRSPRADEKDPAYADGVIPYPARDAEDEAAAAQKMASMRQARHIVDQERQQWMTAQTPTRAAEFRPRQVVDGDEDEEDVDAAMEHELGRKKSPPGRKPVPAYLPAGTVEATPNSAPATDEPLTPAQRIIHETRSKQLAREQIEAQRKHAFDQQTQLRQTPKAEPLPPVTPPKSTSATGGHGQRFPSGAHQLTREPARATGSSTLSPGSGPMPAEMPLRDALQEMMVRFYRFERYSVPLIRALEQRLVDIERDAMLASNPHARGSVGSASSAHSAEMDRWVTQMTRLMKHEVGQLKAATREIKESRELVAHVARTAPQEGKHGAPSVPVSTSISSFGSIHAVTPSASASLQHMPPVIESPSNARQTNVSSSTFESAVPRNGAGAAVPRNLVLPAGAKPALDKDEGKHTTASPTKAIFGFASESVRERDARERSVSPNGRPRFTSVLGQPLVHGRLSPAPASPASAEPGMKRDVSVEDRLKALVDGASTRSRSSSFASGAPVVSQDAQEEGDDSGAADITAALAAIEATSHEQQPSTHTLDTVREPVAVAKSASHSSSGSVEEPLTPPLEDGPAPADATPLKARGLSYLSNAAADESKAPAAVASGRISPNKLFAHKFAATASSASAHSAHSAHSATSNSPSAKLGLVEKKRFTLGAPVSPVSTGGATPWSGRVSRTPSATFEDTPAATTAPTSAAFSALAKVKPVGHTATLRERVAFFDTAK